MRIYQHFQFRTVSLLYASIHIFRNACGIIGSEIKPNGNNWGINNLVVISSGILLSNGSLTRITSVVSIQLEHGI